MQKHQQPQGMVVIDDQEKEDVRPPEEDEGYDDEVPEQVVYARPKRDEQRSGEHVSESDEEDGDDDELRVSRRPRKDSVDSEKGSELDVPRRSGSRKRADSSDESQGSGHGRRRRVSSSSSDEGQDQSPKRQRRQRADSTDSETDRKHKQSEEEEDVDVTNTLSGKNAKTVYRDKQGHRIDVGKEMEKRQNEKALKKELEKTAKFDWNVGSAQKREKMEYAKRLEKAKTEKISRDVDDEELETDLKSQFREGDPMARMLQKKQRKEENKSASGKPLYKGPPPPPNRFNIRPGYRWDGVDRSNGWEAKVIAKMAESSAKQQQAYQMSTAAL